MRLIALDRRLSVIVERRVQRIAGDVPHLRGDEIGSVEGEGIHREGSEGSLVAEHDRQCAVSRMLQADADALMTLRRGIRSTQQQLSAHPQMRDHGGRGTLERKPEEFSASGRTDDASTLQPPDEVCGAGRMPRERTLVEHRHVGDGGAEDRGRETGTDDLDFRELRHVR